MKKLLLSGAAMLFAAASYAQGNTSTVTQTGTSQTANAGQTGSSLTSTISQVGTVAGNTNNSGVTSQTGVGHLSLINQNTDSKFNKADITQNGIVSGVGSNTATVNQNASGGSAATGNVASVTQVGATNQVTVDQNNGAKNGSATAYQYGSDNVSTINQTGSTNATAQTMQGLGPQYGLDLKATHNLVVIDQSGSTSNYARVGQLTSGNSATVVQSGNQSSNNYAFILQNYGPTATAVSNGSNRAIIQQETNTPEAPSTTSLSTYNQAYITQLGDNSYADIKQRKDADQNYASIFQHSGNGSDARIQQEFQATSLNDARINQYGDGQIAYAAQIKADHNKLTIDQGSASTTSSANRAYVFQSFSDYGTVAVRQNVNTAGSGNFTEIMQEVAPTVDPNRTTGNVATITQEDSRNSTVLRQTGVGSNSATVGQSGNNNIVKGTANVHDVNAPGFQPDIPIAALQDGFQNKMTVTQNSPGGSNNVLFNTATLSQTGTGNMLKVDQTATTVGNMATVTQNGSQNQSIVMQNGVSN